MKLKVEIYFLPILEKAPWHALYHYAKLISGYKTLFQCSSFILLGSHYYLYIIKTVNFEKNIKINYFVFWIKPDIIEGAILNKCYLCLSFVHFNILSLYEFSLFFLQVEQVNVDTFEVQLQKNARGLGITIYGYDDRTSKYRFYFIIENL